MKRILVPCDFSMPSKEAYKFALELALISKGEIFVIHNIQLPLMPETTFGIQPYPVDPELVKRIEDQATQAFEKMKQSYYVPVPVPIHFKLIYDFLLQGIQSAIKENNIDLVIMGTHGSSGLQEFVIGSNTEKVVRFSPVPVIAVRKATAFGSIQNIVFPNSLELNQSHLINHIVSLQEFFHAKLHILSVNTPAHFKSDDEAHEAMQEFVNHYKLKNYTLNFRNSYKERDGILSFAHEIQADMIALATHSKKGLQHFISGSTAESVVNHLGCPVWTYSLNPQQ